MASLYIEFEDSGSEHGDIEYLDLGESGFCGSSFESVLLGNDGPGTGGEADEADSAGIESPDEVVGVAPRGGAPRRQWVRVPARHRRILVGAVIAAGIGAAVSDSLVAQAAQRAADRPTLDLIDASYTQNTDGDGFDMLIDLGNTGSSTATITAVTVDQPGLSLLYPGSEAAVGSRQQIEIVLGGRFDCSGLTGDAPKIQVTLHTVHGTAADLYFPVPANAALPVGWLTDRAAFCDALAQAAGFQ